MLRVLNHRTYRHLFAAQAIALVGTGLLTVALGLLAYDLAGADAGLVLGTALAIKMVAYVTIAPVASAFAERLPRRPLLVALDLVRAVVALGLPFVSEVWQVYLLIFVLQAASAGFTPTFQATIPDVLPEERDYTQALSLSRLAYDLESLLSPLLAATLLAVVSYSDLFAGTVLGFLGSAALVLSVRLPQREPGPPRGVWARTTRGMRLYLATPRLRGLLALNLSAAAAGAMVIVNTVAIVREEFGLGEGAVAWALAAFGGGSMAAALTLPRLLEQRGDRGVMLAGAGLLVGGLVLGAADPGYPALLAIWALMGVGYSVVQTPSGRLLRRSGIPADRPALFAAQFALSHACWLFTYPLAGWLGTAVGMPATFLLLGGLAVLATLLAFVVWPAGEEAAVMHSHEGLPPDHPHLAGGARVHAHPVIVDELHPMWARG